MKIIEMKLGEILPYARNPRKNDAAVAGVAASIKEFGFRQPIVVDKDKTIIVGHTRWKAAQQLGLETVPVVVAGSLTPQQVKAYRLLDNKLAERAEWDDDLLRLEVEELDIDLVHFDVSFDSLAPVTLPEGKEFDEDVAAEVQYCECPACGHKFPK